MKCFYHHDHDAVALCKACHRALCPECSADVPPGTACKDQCEKEVEQINEITTRNKSVFQKTGTVYRVQAIAILLLGSVFFVLGLFGDYFLVVGGLIFLFWSISIHKSAKAIESLESTKKDD